MKKIICVIVLAMFLASLLAGCGKAPVADSVKTSADPEAKQEETTTSIAEADKEPVKLTFLCNETPVLTKDFWKIPGDKYSKMHPEVTIDEIFQPSSNIQIRDYAKTLLATGQFPDVLVMPTPGEFVNADALMPFEDSEVDAVKLEFISRINGKIYVVPYKIQVGGVFYNKKIFADNGLTEPKTYADFIAICDKLAEENITPIAVGMKESWAQILTWINLLSADMNSFNPDFPAEIKAGKAKFSTTPEFVNANKKYQLLLTKYTNKDRLSMSHTQSLEYFYSGKAGMYIQGSWTQADDARLNHDFEVGYFIFPGDKDNSIIPIWANEGLSVSASTKAPAVAKDFINFFITDQEWMSQFLKTEQLFSVTKEDIPYEQTALHKEVAAKLNNAKGIENFYDAVGDNTWLPGVTQLFDKLSVKLGTDPKAVVEDEIQNLDKEYEKITLNAN